MKTLVNYNIRWMIQRDFEEVQAIENKSFEFPFDQEDFRILLSRRNAVGKVVEHDNRVAGFMIYELHKERFRIIDLAVLIPRVGIGSSLVNNLVRKLHPGRRRMITADVRESNLPAQLFFREMGFIATGIDHSPYDNIDEDAYKFTYLIEEDHLAMDCK